MVKATDIVVFYYEHKLTGEWGRAVRLEAYLLCHPKIIE